MLQYHSSDASAQELDAFFADLAAELALADDRPLTGKEVDFLAELALVGADDAPEHGVAENGSIEDLSDGAPSEVSDKSGTKADLENIEKPQSNKGCQAGAAEACLVIDATSTPLDLTSDSLTHAPSDHHTSTPTAPLTHTSDVAAPSPRLTLHDVALNAFNRITSRARRTPCTWSVDRAKAARDAAHARLTAPAPVPPPTPVPPPLPTRWRDLTPAQVFNLSARVAEAGEGVGISLNLGDAVERALAAAPDRISYMARRISRSLAAACLAGLPYAFQIEPTKNGRLHLHGVLILGDLDPAKVKTALMQAGGKIPGRAASRQIFLDPLFDGGGWAGYSSKEAKGAVPGDRLSFVSPALKKLVKTFYDQVKPSRSQKPKQKVAAPAQGLSEAPYRPASFEGYPGGTQPRHESPWATLRPLVQHSSPPVATNAPGFSSARFTEPAKRSYPSSGSGRSGDDEGVARCCGDRVFGRASCGSATGDVQGTEPRDLPGGRGHDMARGQEAPDEGLRHARAYDRDLRRGRRDSSGRQGK